MKLRFFAYHRTKNFKFCWISIGIQQPVSWRHWNTFLSIMTIRKLLVIEGNCHGGWAPFLPREHSVSGFLYYFPPASIITKWLLWLVRNNVWEIVWEGAIRLFFCQTCPSCLHFIFFPPLLCPPYLLYFLSSCLVYTHMFREMFSAEIQSTFASPILKNSYHFVLRH